MTDDDLLAKIDFDPPMDPDEGSRWHANIEADGFTVTGFGDDKESAAADAMRRFRAITRPIAFCPACGSGADVVKHRHDNDSHLLWDWSDGEATPKMVRVRCPWCNWMGAVCAFQSCDDSLPE
jgi:hypothetical protein